MLQKSRTATVSLSKTFFSHIPEFKGGHGHFFSHIPELKAAGPVTFSVFRANQRKQPFLRLKIAG